MAEGRDFAVVSGRCAHDVIYSYNKNCSFCGCRSYVLLPHVETTVGAEFCTVGPTTGWSLDMEVVDVSISSSMYV
jgi:hypothetical protein